MWNTGLHVYLRRTTYAVLARTLTAGAPFVTGMHTGWDARARFVLAGSRRGWPRAGGSDRARGVERGSWECDVRRAESEVRMSVNVDGGWFGACLGGGIYSATSIEEIWKGKKR